MCKHLNDVEVTSNILHSAVTFVDEFLVIKEAVWKMMFDHVLNPTIQHVNKLLQEPKLMRKCKFLCLAGGLIKTERRISTKITI